MKTKLTLDPTRIGYYLMLGFPVGLLAYDWFLKFVLHLPTISDDVWAAGLSTRIGVSAYLLLSAIALTLHFVFMLFDGGTEATPVAKEEPPTPGGEISLPKPAELEVVKTTKPDLEQMWAASAGSIKQKSYGDQSGAPSSTTLPPCGPRTPRSQQPLVPNIPRASKDGNTGRVPIWGGCVYPYNAYFDLPPRPPELPNNQLGFNLLSLEHLLWRRRVRVYYEAVKLHRSTKATSGYLVRKWRALWRYFDGMPGT